MSYLFFTIKKYAFYLNKKYIIRINRFTNYNHETFYWIYINLIQMIDLIVIYLL